MTSGRLILAATAAIAFAGVAQACEGQKVLFEDHFAAAALDPSWGTYGDELTVEGGRMVIRPEPDMVYWQTNDLAMYGDVDICANLTITDSVTPDEVLGGVVFWYVDDDDLYALEADASGHAAIWRRLFGNWIQVVPWQDSDLVKMGDGITNALEVVTTGTTAVTSINGKPFMTVTTDLPFPQGSMVGVIAGSAGIATSTVALDDFVVTPAN